MLYASKMMEVHRDTWGIKLVPQLNHDLISSMSAMKEGWQMNGRWKRHGIEI